MSTDTPERLDRDGDTEPMPIGNDLPVMHDLVTADLQDRLAIGIKRYGQPLQPFNGRNAAKDAYDEVLDLAVYLRQLLYERDAARDGLTDALRIINSAGCPDFDTFDSSGACVTCQGRPTECPQMRAIAACRSLGGLLPSEVKGEGGVPWEGGPIPLTPEERALKESLRERPVDLTRAHQAHTRVELRPAGDISPVIRP